MSRKCFGVKRALGLGFNNRLNDGKSVDGIDPLEEAAGGGCGGSAVEGRVSVRLKVKCINRPRP